MSAPLLTIPCPRGIELRVFEDGSLRIINERGLDATGFMTGNLFFWMKRLAARLAEAEREKNLWKAEVQAAAAESAVLRELCEAALACEDRLARCQATPGDDLLDYAEFDRREQQALAAYRALCNGEGR